MASTSRRYYFSNENDAEELGQLRLMEESDNDERILTTEEESDTDASVSVEDREGDSETEQSKSDNNEVIEDSSAYYTAVQKQRNKIVATWEWKKVPFSQRRRTPSQNVIVRLPGVIGDARKVKGVYETWQVLINDNILNDIVRYTNQYIERIQTKFTRTRDDRKTHIIEIKAFIGLLYLAVKQYDNFIENALQMREDAIAREKQLIGQSSYFLNKSGSKWLTVGLSPAAGFVPIVQIKSVNACIFFTQEEWEEFCKTEGCSPNHQMEASSYRDIQVIRLKSRGQQIVLSTETYNNIYHLQELINQKISVLASSDFVSFYNHVLKSCTKMDGDLYSNIITLLATQTNSQNTITYVFVKLYYSSSTATHKKTYRISMDREKLRIRLEQHIEELQELKAYIKVCTYTNKKVKESKNE
ncbi:hypothetical protein MML48_2g00015430 [Holotrichia oblita]|uniref:Uncharacterized protein n=1 Tax=Holotrichia oblita TaxID=644536 RepID=A0ACB9TLS3_HOLOL|nr:hypothetical protein MML48_2g00015430 [Holotrichia oblita]